MSKHVPVYSPDGEMFETSALNAHDLVTHANWSYEVPGVAKAAPAPTPAPTPAPEPDETDTDETDDASDEAGEDESVTVRKTADDFADLTTREDVIAYLAAAFPDFKPHHLAGRDKLVEKAVELANA